MRTRRVVATDYTSAAVEEDCTVTIQSTTVVFVVLVPWLGIVVVDDNAWANLSTVERLDHDA